MNLHEALQEFNAKFKFGDDYTTEKRENRFAHIKEELDEYAHAIATGDTIGQIDALIDIIYLAVGTMTLEGWDTNAHFRAVHEANMAKVRGVNPNRPNSGGFDVYKPEGWVPPEARHAEILEKNKS